MSPNNFTWDHSKKKERYVIDLTEWLVTGVTSAGSPDRAERDILEAFVAVEPLCDL